jgi:hypothetical protein
MVVISTNQRAVCLNDDVVLLTIFDYRSLLTEWMNLASSDVSDKLDKAVNQLLLLTGLPQASLIRHHVSLRYAGCY